MLTPQIPRLSHSSRVSRPFATRRVSRSAAVGVEPLESRRLLDATLVNGVVEVVGTPLSDDILIYRQPDIEGNPVYAVVIGPINGERSTRPTRLWTFPAAQVRSFSVRAGSGDDVVDLAVATFSLPATIDYGPVTVPSQIDGGLGDDKLYGGEARDVIVGGFGRDRIEGRGGEDLLLGGYGNDLIHGGGGNDLVLAGPGNDSVSGDEGDDRLFGDTGNDWLGAFSEGPSDEPGNDLIVGGPGADTLMGGNGDDRLYGGPGPDRFFFSDGPSEMKDRGPEDRVDAPPPGVL